VTRAPRRPASTERLKLRADFVAAASGTRIPAGAFVLQARHRRDDQPARFGFTVSKKVGNAPERNRVRRRLRELVRVAAVTRAQPGYDYVLVGRRAALAVPFPQLSGELEAALRRLHDGPARRPAGTRPRPDRLPRGDGGNTQ